MQFGAGFQFLEKYVDTKHKNQHDKDDSNRQMVTREIGAPNMEIVIRRGEALTYHRHHADEHTPHCDTAVSKRVGSRKA